MKLDIWEMLKAVFNPTFIKLVIFLLVVGAIFRIMTILFDRKLKLAKPTKLKSSTLFIIAFGLSIFAFILLRYLN